MPMEDSVLSSDDAGFFSETELTEEEEREAESEQLPSQIIPTTISIVSRDYDNLLVKYKNLLEKVTSKKPNLEDPFSQVCFDELLQVLILSTCRSGLQVTALLLYLAIIILGQQTVVVSREIHNQVERINNEYRLKRKRPLAEANKNTNHGAITNDYSNEQRQNDVTYEIDDDDYAMHCSQDSGYGSSQVGESSQQSQSYLESPPAKLRRLNHSRGNPKKSFIADEMLLTLDENMASIDVVSRRKRLHFRFQELTNDLYSNFNWHNEYESELASSFNPGARAHINDNADASPFFQWMKNRSSGSNSSQQMSQLLRFEYEDVREESSPPPDDIESIDFSLDTNNDNPSKITEVPQSENFMMSEMIWPTGPVVVLPNSPLREQENATENFMDIIAPFNLINEQSVIKTSKKERGPLGLLNISTENIQDMSQETKRAALCDTIDDLVQSPVLIDREASYADCELPVFPLLSNSASMQINEIDSTMALDESDNVRVPSPLFGESGSSKESFLVRPPPVNFKAIISKMENVARDEFKNKKTESMNFLDWTRKSKLDLISPNDWDKVDPTTSNHSTVSVPMAFFASLHVAHSQNLYLVSTDDNMFNITTKMSPEHKKMLNDELIDSRCEKPHHIQRED